MSRVTRVRMVPNFSTRHHTRTPVPVASRFSQAFTGSTVPGKYSVQPLFLMAKRYQIGPYFTTADPTSHIGSSFHLNFPKLRKRSSRVEEEGVEGTRVRYGPQVSPLRTISVYQTTSLPTGCTRQRRRVHRLHRRQQLVPGIHRR
jgi:hypothetical protein